MKHLFFRGLCLAVLFACLFSFTACGYGCGRGDKYKIACFAYKFDDSYVTTVRTALENGLKAHRDEITMTIYNGENNQQAQSAQIDTALTQGVDLLLINAVDFQAAGEGLAKKAKDKRVPAIFFNREVSDAAIAMDDQFCFVGTDPDAPGYMVGELIAEMLGSDEAFRRYDKNGDGKIQYAMFRAEVGNAEADGRTQYSVSEANRLLAENDALTAANKTGGVLTRVGADQLANWSSATANNMMGSLFQVVGGVPNVELVICNNDDMALGVISALEAKGYNRAGSREGDPDHYIPVFGVDALSTAMDAIRAGKMQGTVRQDGAAMADAILRIVFNIKEGRPLLDGTDYAFDEGTRKLRIPYYKITAEDTKG